MIDFGFILRDLRKENGLTQAKLAKILGVAAPSSRRGKAVLNIRRLISSYNYPGCIPCL